MHETRKNTSINILLVKIFGFEAIKAFVVTNFKTK